MHTELFSVPAPSAGLFLSSSGGHFASLLYIARKFKAAEQSVLVTYLSPDTKMETLEFSIHYFPYVQSRKIIPLIRMIVPIFKILKTEKFSYIASTGAGIAVIGYLFARLAKLPFYYVEDFNRQTSLSLTAKILQRIGLKKIFVQSQGLASISNIYLEHPINNYVVSESIGEKMKENKEIFVALGTIQGFDFPRAIDLVLSVIEESDVVRWQIGDSRIANIEKLCGTVYTEIDRSEFLKFIADADIVVCHGGNGIIGECLAAGKIPVVIPRRKIHGEHIDDHQVDMVEILEAKGLVLNLETVKSRTQLIKTLEGRSITYEVK